MKDNFFVDMFCKSINHMSTETWAWPEHWDAQRKFKFLDECMEYAEKTELYEQCTIIRDVKETIKNKTR
jgi:hypothetical protein